MRLLLDMGLSPNTAELLHVASHDADHVIERGLGTMSDDQILNLVQVERRIVITFDLDFPRLLALNCAVQASVVLFRVESVNTARMIEWLLDLLTRYQTDLETGAILVVDGNHEHIRTLPIWSCYRQGWQGFTQALVFKTPIDSCQADKIPCLLTNIAT